MPRYHQWIFTRPCDCPVAVCEGYLADTAEGAFNEMYELPHERDRAMRDGISVRLISFQTYLDNYYEKMKTTYTCQHDSAA